MRHDISMQFLQPIHLQCKSNIYFKCVIALWNGAYNIGLYSLSTLLLGVCQGVIWHTNYRKNNNLEKCAGIGLNGFQIR